MYLDRENLEEKLEILKKLKKILKHDVRDTTRKLETTKHKTGMWDITVEQNKITNFCSVYTSTPHQIILSNWHCISFIFLALHKLLKGMKHTHPHFLFYISLSQKSNTGLTGLKSLLAGLHSFLRLWRRMCFLGFSSFQRPPTFFGLWSSSCIFEASDATSLWLICHHIFLWVSWEISSLRNYVIILDLSI